MENKNGSDMSTTELLRKLKANMNEEDESRSSDGKKKYKFRRSEKINSPVSDEEKLFESPVPKSDIEDLDIDALMKKYLPEQDYERMTGKVNKAEDEEEFVRTLSSIEIKESENADGENGASFGRELAAPESELYDELSEGGKVCDVPDFENRDEKSDTRQAPLRPMSEIERTIAFGNEDDEEEGGFISVRELEAVSQKADDSRDDPEATLMINTEKEIDSAEKTDEEPVTIGDSEKEANDETAVFETIAFEAPVIEEASSEESIEEKSAELNELTESSDNGENAVYEDEEFDETDANIMLAFGMDEELEQAVGKESADKIRSEVDGAAEAEEKKKNLSDSSAHIKEFVSPSEIKNILESYKAEYGRSALRLFAMIAIAILLFFYENIGAFGGSLPDAISAKYYPIVNVMVGLQLLFMGFAILYNNIIAGFKALFKKRPTTDSFLPIMLLISVAYSVCACFFPAGSSIVSYHFPIAMSLLLFVVGQRLDLKREVMTFRVISSKRNKFALEKLDIIDAELETRAFDKFLPKQPDIFRINKTTFVDGYFRRTKSYSSVKLSLLAFIPLTVIAALGGVLIGLFATKNIPTAVTTGYAAFAFACPVSAFVAFSLPMFRSSKVCYDNNSAIVGEGALDEYTSASSISFDDREVFPTAGVKLRSIKVFGNGRLDNVIYYMASVYSFIGGPLSDVLNVATADLGRSDNVEILGIDSDGVEAVVDGHHVFAGKAEYLRHNGYLPVSDPEDEEIEGGDICITFLVCDDEVVGKFYVRYRIDPEFQNTLKSLYRSGICVGIKTVDPNINDEMLGTRIRLTKYPVRVLKYDDLDDRSRGAERTDSGIVSKKSVKALLTAFTLCDKTKHITKTNLLICALTIIIGLVITAGVSFMGTIAAVGSVYAALFQLFWLIPVYLISRFLLM